MAMALHLSNMFLCAEHAVQFIFRIASWRASRGPVGVRVGVSQANDVEL
jgi:hypothetical protein